MAESVTQVGQSVTTDFDFLGQLMGFGADDVMSCYQCGTCSVVCPLTPVEQPFPRKEMVWAQWGLKDKLIGSGDVWLCHQCNECSVHCPRDAKPGDLMAATRNYQIQHYAVGPKALKKGATELKYTPLVFVIPLLLTFGLLLSAVIVPEGGVVFPEGDVLFEHFIPHILIDVFSVLAMGYMAVVATIAGRRFWTNIKETEVNPPATRGGFLASLIISLVEVLRHKHFKLCQVNRTRYHAHMGILYGFLFLVAATTGSFIYTVILGRELSLPLWDPVKIIGNFGGLILLAGLTWISYRRLAKRNEAGKAGYFDWFFVGLLYITTLTGFLLEAIRFAELSVLAYSIYLVHLVFYFTLFTYLPYSKFAHVIYRTLAMTHARQIGRKIGAQGLVAQGST